MPDRAVLGENQARPDDVDTSGNDVGGGVAPGGELPGLGEVTGLGDVLLGGGLVGGALVGGAEGLAVGVLDGTYVGPTYVGAV